MLGCIPPGEDEWQLLSLPIRFDGLGIPAPSRMAVVKSEVSGQVTAPLVSALCKQDPYLCAILEEQAHLKAKARQGKLAGKIVQTCS